MTKLNYRTYSAKKNKSDPLEKITIVLNAINHLSVRDLNIQKNGFYTHSFKDRAGNQSKVNVPLEYNQRVITYATLTERTKLSIQTVRTAIKKLIADGKIKTTKLCKVLPSGWETKEIIGQIVTILPQDGFLIKQLTLQKRRILNRQKSLKNDLKSNRPKQAQDGCLINKNNFTNRQNIYSNNKPQKINEFFSTIGIKIKSKDIDFLKGEEIIKVEEYKIFEIDANLQLKLANKKLNTLKKQLKSKLKSEIKLSLMLSKQALVTNTIMLIKPMYNEIMEDKKNLNNSIEINILRNQKAKAFDFIPKGKEIINDDKINNYQVDNNSDHILLTKEESKSIRVDEDNLIPAKYKQQFIDMTSDDRITTLWLYKELNATVGLVNRIEKQKLIRSIMKKYWEGDMSVLRIKSYTEEIRKTKNNHYIESREIYDYWGLFMKLNGSIGNATAQDYGFDNWDSR